MFSFVVHFKCLMKIIPILDLIIDLSQAVFFSHWWGLLDILLGVEEGREKKDGCFS